MALSVRISPAELPEKLRQHAEEARATILRVVRETVRLHGDRLIQEEISSSQPLPVDRGTYRRSFRTADLPDGAVLYNPLPYAAVIEFGRRPGSRPPPVSALVEWVFRKKLVVRPRGRGSKAQDAYRQALGIAYVIARSIGRKGMKPRHILTNVERHLTPLVLEEIQKALEAA